jgi:hypothetical protein
MSSFYFDDPLDHRIEKTLDRVTLEYFYFENTLTLESPKDQVLCGCLLSGNASIEYDGKEKDFELFDFFFLPEDKKLSIKSPFSERCKICTLYSPIMNRKEMNFILESYKDANFIERGEMGSKQKMTTFRKVWTAIKNGYFMAGITSIPNQSLRRGVVTSVNIEKIEGNSESKESKGTGEISFKVLPHIHPDYPEVYIFAIDDKNYAITQYLINQEGETVCKDLTDGQGLFFLGNLGHMNFGRPFYKDLQYCYYIWIIPTFGLKNTVKPITLPV